MEKKIDEKKVKSQLRLVVPWKRQLGLKVDQTKMSCLNKVGSCKEGLSNKKVLRIGMRPLKTIPLKSLSPVERKKKAAKKRKVKLQMAQGNNNGNHFNNENKILLPKLQDSNKVDSQIEHPVALKPINNNKDNTILPSFSLRTEHLKEEKPNIPIDLPQLKEVNKTKEIVELKKDNTKDKLNQCFVNKSHLIELPLQHLPPPIIKTKKELFEPKEIKKDILKKKEGISIKKKKEKKLVTPKKRGRKPKPKYSLSNEKKDRVKQTMSFILKSINRENKKRSNKNNEEKKPKREEEKILKKKGKFNNNIIGIEKVKEMVKECTL
ncbi:hypothetical protein EHI8A_113170 [Entamoeba histolytica HM-1:IMSS-B]|uniref:Uncharacterized protein n=6 Tax=Entamoeba histolytica TaxID=5759 RepID=C4LSR2_ENTH1|nr:hypothetical protein EHI_152240 [Entamoeba histolytica HM-1:IMSS]EMD49299.1 Hypothetical protein EHI5A_001020 [Entamoeba histolytica KU27]EMH74501.1 hypothetical protein EHI8A_113170 [Entamoeba histolytica HM-1:IMSS-B]EMS10790.1 hypothetical protein KM1_001440 [Entamoeba histolytica HM-3:IMSS]ENY60568.1 hypothetical protein EHI7A_106020 [Entamoeba histolytica HM-1:IMSS-A]GAT91474.1 hypothetical protein CL6EHI_152240 [Entamoeba histolytica]|eukprot:XP_656987.1 hypothetical protein EHI_152240 [Entamoeba histolytica HM-1:IMSS]